MENLITLQEAAEYLRVHEMTVYRWLNRGMIPATKIGGRWRIRKQDLEAMFTKGYKNALA